MIDYSKLPKDAFACPKCGGSYYGRVPHGKVHCHDQFEQNCQWSGPVDECMYVSDEAKLELAEEMLEKAEAKLDFFLLGAPGADMPWTVTDVLKRLADAADHLLLHHDCDCQGHEEIRVACEVAKTMSKAL